MQSSWRFRVEAKCFQWLECFNPAQGIAAWGGGVGEQSTPFLRSQILTLLAQTLPAAEQTNLSLRAIRNPLIVNVWFYQFLLHKHLMDLFEDARIIKQKKNKKRGGLLGANSPHANSSCLLGTYRQAYTSSHSSSESLLLVKVVNPQDFCCQSQDFKWGV